MGALSSGRATQLPARARQPDIWGINGINYHQTINDNMLVVVMIETPTGVANAYDIASVPGVDVVIIGNNDLSWFSGFAQTDERYHQLVQKVHDDTLRAGKIFGQANATYATGPYSKDSYFFQNGPSNDGWQPPKTAALAQMPRRRERDSALSVTVTWQGSREQLWAPPVFFVPRTLGRTWGTRAAP